MARIVDPSKFAAEGAIVDWSKLWEVQRAAAAAGNLPLEVPRPDRSADLQLRWLVSPLAGVPPRPFTVWRRLDGDAWRDLRVTQSGTLLTWESNEPLFGLQVRCTPIDPARPSVLWGYRTVDALESAVAVSPPVTGPGARTLVARAGSMTFARLINGRIEGALGEPADLVANLPHWERLELVGLPYFSAEWSNTSYDGPKQGLVTALQSPFEAAVDRLQRAAPLLGWWPVTETGHEAPPWLQTDLEQLVKEVAVEQLPQIKSLFEGNVAPAKQHLKRGVYQVQPPEQDGNVVPPQAPQDSKATVELFGAFVLAAATDPFMAIACGFGTGYPLNINDGVIARADLMVTADYPRGLQGEGEVEYASLIPRQQPHFRMISPLDLTAVRIGLIKPVERDQPWIETIGLDWQALPVSPMANRVTGAAACRFDRSRSGPATSLLEKRRSGGWRPPAPMRQPPPRDDRLRLVDGDQDLPRDGTVVERNYAVAQQDPFGVWSPWEDVIYQEREPDQPIPVIGEVVITSTYTGSTVCATTLDIVVTLDWAARSVTFLAVDVQLFPVLFHGAPFPDSLPPAGPAPAGGRQLDLRVRFDLAPGQPTPLTPGLSVEWLPLKEGQPTSDRDEVRRYRLTLTGHSLDFSTTQHYGAAVWARQASLFRTDWSAYPPLPARAYVSSPVPILVPAVPLQIVPLGSLPDADGRSHVQVRLTGLSEANRLTLWSVSETRLRHEERLGGIPRDQSLSERFATLKDLFMGLSSQLKREVFTRVRDIAPGPTVEDVALPKGSREIHFFLATATTSANVESPWPTHVDQLQAAAAPTLVEPGVPDVSAQFMGTGATARIALEIGARSRVKIATFEVHRTSNVGATTTAGMMGPPIAVVTATVVPITPGERAHPAGQRYQAVFTDPGLPDWRRRHYRVVAVPELALSDVQNGLVGRRSKASSLASMTLPPDEAPQVHLVETSLWGAARDGVRLLLRTDAPDRVVEAGAFTWSCTEGTVTMSRAMHEITVGSVQEPPAAVGDGAFTRATRPAGQAEVAVWLKRATPQTAVAVELTLRDPLGRTRRLSVPIAAEPEEPAPEIEIGVASSVQPNRTIIEFTMNAPTEASPLGDWMLLASVLRTAGSPVQSDVTIAVPLIRDEAEVPNPTGRLAFARRGSGANMIYLARVRLPRPFRISLTLTDRHGRVVSDAAVIEPDVPT